MRLNVWFDRELPEVAQALYEEHRAFSESERTIGAAGQTRVYGVIGALRSVLFPGMYENQPIDENNADIFIAARLREAGMSLVSLVGEALENDCRRSGGRTLEECEERAREITRTFLSSLPDIRRELALDIQAAYDGDPAARFREEILLSYPGFDAVMIYRLAHVLYKEKTPVIPRIMTEYAHCRTGIDIHPGATIGKSFFIDHGTGVVVGETCTIGDRVKMYQGVTLGARSFDLDENGNPVKGIKRHPDIGDDVIIYSGATILGGDTVIGRGSIIGGNVWLTHSVPPDSRVYNAQPDPIIR